MIKTALEECDKEEIQPMLSGEAPVPNALSLPDADADSSNLTARGIVKVTGFAVLMMMSIGLLSLGRVLFSRPDTKRRFSIRLAHFLSRCLVRWMSIDLEVVGMDRARMAHKPYFLVSNHLSSLDMLLISSALPMVFMGSEELRETLFEGTIARVAGSLFAERRNKRGIRKEIKQATDVLREKFPLLVFVESATSNGDAMLPFKNAFFQSAIDAGAAVLPLCLQYTEVDGEPVRRANRDRIFYYGDMRFIDHLLSACCTRTIRARLEFLPEISVVSGENRKQISARTRQSISDAFKPLQA